MATVSLRKLEKLVENVSKNLFYSSRITAKYSTTLRCLSNSRNEGKNGGITKEMDKESATEEKQGVDNTVDPYAAFPNDVNPVTGEKGGPRGPEPTRYGDWERKGRCIDF